MKHRERSRAARALIVCVLIVLTLVIFVLLGQTALESYAKSVYCPEGAAPAALTDGTGSPSAVTASSTALVSTAAAASGQLVPSNDLYAQEALLGITYKSCLGKYCMDGDFKDAQGNMFTRVGILSPDGEWHTLTTLLESLHHVSDSKARFEFVPSTHVPPYGYGRNHGLSRIIRIVERVPTLAYRLIAAESPSAADMSRFYETQIRQLVRWHCRLNHVAAHSAMLTVFVEDLVSRPIFEIQRMASFVGFKIREEDILPLLDKLSLPASPSAILVPNWQQIAAETLREEMRSSKNLSRWPCHNFKELESRVVLPHRRFYMFSPNCSTPFVKCSVQYDFREQRDTV